MTPEEKIEEIIREVVQERDPDRPRVLLGWIVCYQTTQFIPDGDTNVSYSHGRISPDDIDPAREWGILQWGVKATEHDLTVDP